MALVLSLAGIIGLPLEGAHAGNCIWAGGFDTDWSNDFNWLGCGHTPGAGDTATITDVTNDPVLASDVTIDTLTINTGGVLTINSMYTLTTGTFNLYGELTGAGLLSVTTTMNWEGVGVQKDRGLMSGTGVTQIESGAALNFSNNAVIMNLKERTLNNYGTATWLQRSDLDIDGAVFNNHGTMESRNQLEWGDFSIFGRNGATFNNQGTLDKNGLDKSTLWLELSFNNSGLVNINHGVLIVARGGTHTGDFVGDDGTRLEFGISGLPGGTFNFNASSIIMAPIIYFYSGTANIYGSYDAFGSGETTTSINTNTSVYFKPGSGAGYLGDKVYVSGILDLGSESTSQPEGYHSGSNSTGFTAGKVTHYEGTITGERDLSVSVEYVWYRGTRSGAGQTSVEYGATLTLNGNKYLNGHTFINNGIATWKGSGYINASNGAKFINNKVFIAKNNSQFKGCGNATFYNNDVFQKNNETSTPTTTTINVEFINDGGTVDVIAGTLNFTCGASDITTIPETGGTFTSFDDAITIDVSSEITESLTLTYTQQTTSTHGAGDFQFAGVYFNLEAVDESGDPLLELTTPFTMTVNYDENSLPVGMDENDLEVYRYDVDSGLWVALVVIERDIDDNSITVQLDHLSEFALAGPVPEEILYLPVIYRNY